MCPPKCEKQDANLPNAAKRIRDVTLFRNLQRLKRFYTYLSFSFAGPLLRAPVRTLQVGLPQMRSILPVPCTIWFSPVLWAVKLMQYSLRNHRNKLLGSFMRELAPIANMFTEHVHTGKYKSLAPPYRYLPKNSQGFTFD